MKKDLYNRILERKSKEQHLCTVLKSCSYIKPYTLASYGLTLHFKGYLQIKLYIFTSSVIKPTLLNLIQFKPKPCDHCSDCCKLPLKQNISITNKRKRECVSWEQRN